MTDDRSLQRAAEAVASAEALLIGAGAGMGVDSGLPDFRGDKGFWKAYPPYEKLGLKFTDLADPSWFVDDPAVAWGFYGHRLNLYQATRPHAGFEILRRWAARMKHGAFVYTSNVDGHFQRAGFDAECVAEIHGTIEWMQCLHNCSAELFPASAPVVVDETTMRAVEPLPKCPECGQLARPNILMFGDGGWDESRTEVQRRRLQKWVVQVGNRPTVIIECGAGLAIPTVRRFSEILVGTGHATLVRINPREPDVPAGNVSLPMGALAALQEIDRRLNILKGSG
jgi:NAD-dependent SIR2 family protein deacetylase